ncbi:MAG: gluconolaconase [Acidimicrobiales bacterium]|nr:gluconolaconase [Acidimicrobiales bacterium]
MTAAPPTEMAVVATGLQFPEGPVALPDGSVLVVEIARGTLTRVTPTGDVDVVAECGGGPNGAAFGPDGRVWICNNGGFSWDRDRGRLVPVGPAADYSGGRIQAVDLESGRVETIYEACDGEPLCAPNDLVFDGAGGLWFTDPGHRRERVHDLGGLFYARADGSEIRCVSWGLDGPNGVGLGPDGTTLYVAMTPLARVYWWPLDGPGEVASPFSNDRGRLLYADARDNVFDSLKVDSAGHVCVASIRKGGIVDIAPDGTAVDVPTGDRVTTNICFGGADLRTAYLTCSGTGTLRTATWARPGLALHHNPYPPIDPAG